MTSTAEWLQNLWDRAPKDVVKLRLTMPFHEENKYVSATFDPGKYKHIELLALTDVQFGHKACQINRFLEFRDWLLSKPNRFGLFLGDMVDAATVLSVGSPYENDGEPQSQAYEFAKIAMPMRHRILGYVGGNHERRSVKTFGDLGKLLATMLRVPYSSGKMLLDIHYGQHKPFKNSLWHGGTGSRTKGAKAQMLHRWMSQGDSQMYWVGHLHDAMVLFDWRTARRDGGTIQLEKVAGVMSSSFLDHWGTYAEVAGMAPSDTMMGRVILEPSGKWELTLR